MADNTVTKRLYKELNQLMMSNLDGISAFPDGENLFKWVGTIKGPQNTPYANHQYRLTLEFPPTYPYDPPDVRFVTPCYHPNVNEFGVICLDILKENWSALLDVANILLSIQSLLGEPNTESPLNVQAAALWPNQEEYKNQLNAFYAEYKDATIDWNIGHE